MGKEQTPDRQPKTNPYQMALEVFNERVDQLKETGEIRRITDITTDEELDDHFDDLRRIYRQVCLEMELAWPPPLINEDPDIKHAAQSSSDGSDALS